MVPLGVVAWWAVARTGLEPLSLAVLSLGAAAIHFGVVAGHFTEYFLFGAFFSLIGWLQALWAIAYVIRPGRWLVAVAILANVATLLLWVWAHLVGLPFGPDSGHLEATTITDLMATAFELLLVAWLGRVILQRPRASERRQPNHSGLFSTVIVVSMIIAIALGSTIALAQPPM